MPKLTTQPDTSSLDRSEKPGNAALLLLLAGILVGAAIALSFLASDRAQPLILMLLALLAMAGVFFLFAAALGAVQFAGRGPRNDITKLISDSANEALLVVEDDGRIIYANQRYLSLCGGGEPRTVERLLTGEAETSEAVYRLVQAAREGRSEVEEIRLSPPLNGTQEFGWYRVKVRPLIRPAGNKASLWSVADVTSDRERQENVFQELQYAIDYLDHAPAGFFSLSPQDEIVYMNATLASWLDHDLAKVGSGGLALRDIAAINTMAMLQSIQGEPGDIITQMFDLDLRRRSGEPLPVRMFHRVAFNSEGKPDASRTLVLNRSPGEDVAEGQRAAEVRFARFFNDTPLAIVTLTRGGRLARFNASFARLFGVLPRANGVGEGRSILDLVADRDRERLDEALKQASSRQIQTGPMDLALTGDTNKAARFWISPVTNMDDDEEGAILYILETTEQRQLEQQFAQAQKMQAVGQLAGGVAHDFNNVLQAIIGYSDLLLTQHRPTDPSFQDIQQIKQNANRAASLVRQLLAFSRQQTLRPQVVSLGDALSDLSLLLKRLLGERVELDLKFSRDLWLVKADINQFEQVILNLAVNARDAMVDGGKLIISTANVPQDEADNLALEAMPSCDYVLIAISDTGQGIPPEVMDKIFEPFFTTKEVGKGTGLGLSTVFGIIKQSGGYIAVDSVVGKGTTFRVYLPRHVQSAEELAAELAAPALLEPKKPAADLTGHGVILLVEDEDPVRAVNSRALSARGYTVLEAASGVEALEIYQGLDRPVDLVVSDVVMPEMDGPTLLGELRKLHPQLKVIFVSGYAEEAFRKNLPEGEQFSFLPKPFSLKQLVETVKTVMAAE
jgi:two-component system, cell cycle sensor histidine kinase and response regulator CckA